MGGSKEQQTQFIPAPAQPAAPSASETSAQAMEAQLKYNPQLYEQYMKSYAQYMPQMAGVEMGVQQEYAPLLKALQQQMYPQQTQLTEALSGQALQRLQSPYGYSTSEQQALDAMRQRQQADLQKQLRERANLSGGLYGGRAQATEQKGLTELGQAFTEQDINRYLQAGQQALQYTTPVLQMQYPQVSQPQMPQYWQGVTPSSDAIYNAMYGASRRDYAVQPYQAAQQSPLWGMAGQAIGTAGTAKIMMMCVPEGTIIDCQKEQKPVEEIEAGDIVFDKEGKLAKVLMKYEFDELPTNDRFLELDFNGKKVVVCDLHKIDGVRAMDLDVPKKFVEMNVRSYDLLTSGKDGSYRSNGIGIDSMIPELHQLTKELQEV